MIALILTLIVLALIIAVYFQSYLIFVDQMVFSRLSSISMDGNNAGKIVENVSM